MLNAASARIWLCNSNSRPCDDVILLKHLGTGLVKADPAEPFRNVSLVSLHSSLQKRAVPRKVIAEISVGNANSKATNEKARQLLRRVC